MADLQCIPYEQGLQDVWDQLVNASRNGTFLLTRPFMDYHADRFSDCSLLFYKKGKLVALFAANHDEDSHTVWAHQGLTYGGFILSQDVYAQEVLDMQVMLEDYYRQQLHARTLIVKPIPSIYHTHPAEEPLYALFRSGAQLIGRGLSSAMPITRNPHLTALRLRTMQRARRAHITIRVDATDENINAFHTLLSECLHQRHGVSPVHTAAEMCLLTQRFPENIRLITAHAPDGTLLAGTWLFICQHVAHTQYLAANDQGRELGALDRVLHEIINCPAPFEAKLIDFGISTEDLGHILNTGLTHFKEGFGARGICYDTYQIDL